VTAPVPYKPSSDAAALPASVSAWFWLCLLSVAAIAQALCVWPIDGLVDPIRLELGITDLQMSVLLGWAFVGPLALCSLPVGWLADRSPRLPILGVGFTLLALGAATCAMAESFLVFCLGRGLTGIGVAALVPIGFSILADTFPVHLRGRVFGVFMCALSTGPAAGMIASGTLLAAGQQLGVAEPWRMVLGAGAIPSLIVAVIMFSVREPARAANVGEGGPAFSADRYLWLPVLLGLAAVAAVATSDGAQVSWMATVLVREHDVSQAQAASWTGYVFLFGAAAPLIGGLLGDMAHKRFGTAGRAMVALIASAISIALLLNYSVESTPLFLMIVTGVGVALVVSETIGATILQDIVPHHRRGIAAAAHNLCMLGAIASGTSLVALVASAYGNSVNALTHAVSAVTVPASGIGLAMFACLSIVLRGTHRRALANSRSAINVQ
jgi:MFS family permease